MNEDYSLAGMMRAMRAANGGKPLSEEQEAWVIARHNEIAEKTKQLADYAAGAEEREREAALVVAVETIKEEVKESRRQAARQWSRHDPAYGSQNQSVTKAEYEATKARLKEALGLERISFSGSHLNSGKPLTEAQTADLTKIGQYHLEAGLTVHKAWCKAMRADLRDINKPAFGSRNKYFTKAEADAAKARLKEDLSRMNVKLTTICRSVYGFLARAIRWSIGCRPRQ